MTEILVTAGPTREHLDDVRFLSNGSTGRMGFAIASAAAARGCSVTLVAGPSSLPTPDGVHRVDVISARDMLDAAETAFDRCDVAFFAAAVADHRPARRASGKPPKVEGPQTLELVPNPDIARTLGARKGRRVCVGFALESYADPAQRDAAFARAKDKLARKSFDLCVVNAPEALGDAASRVVVLARDGRIEELPRQSKAKTAELLVDKALAQRAANGDSS
ncbi:MAG: hypothetical protein HZB39_00615 [Planctomycetes bacterium]|nr:hypothetical protein [Planctomycetota bacterium]